MSSQKTNGSVIAPPKYTIEKMSVNDDKEVVEFLKETFWKVIQI